MSTTFTPEEEKLIDIEYQALLQDYLNSPHRKKVEIIDRAFALARKAHNGVRRRSGEPYILHPIAVAGIVCREMGLGSTSISCALLHDVVEDTDYTVEDIREEFGDKVGQIVEGLTKISGENFNGELSLQAENFRKLLLTMSDDARVILIKIADRLHNMRTLSSMTSAKQYKIAGETLYIYAPLAHRFGLFSIKSELEDLSFSYEHPEAYQIIAQQVKESERGREDLFQRFSAPIKEALEAKGIKFEIKDRIKTNYSIWRKMQNKGIPFSEVYDLFAVRIIFDSEDGYPEKNRCWDIYTIITELYRNRPDRLRDWLSNPKSNGYQALHLTVMGPDGNWIEVQIRSRRMDDIAEKGLAAHWKYKGSQVEEDHEFEEWLDTIREVLQSPTPNAMDFLDTVKLSLYANDITVFTPKGDSIKLPSNASVLDFAYAIHSALGDRCIGAKVNHKVVPVSTRLCNGDQVEILDSKNAHPQPEWLNFVATVRARYRIDQMLRRQHRELAAKGEEKLVAFLHDQGREVTQAVLDKLSHGCGYERKEEFFASIGSGELDLRSAYDRVFGGGKMNSGFIGRIVGSLFGAKSSVAQEECPSEIVEDINPKKSYVLKEVSGHLNYRVAPCCCPVPGDEVLGVIEQHRVVVHKLSCPVATKIKSSSGDSLLSTEWGEHHHSVFVATIAFKGINTLGLLHAITQTLLEDFHISIQSLNIESQGGVFEGEATILVHHTKELAEVCQVLQRNRSILSIYRVAKEIKESE